MGTRWDGMRRGLCCAGVLVALVCGDLLLDGRVGLAHDAQLLACNEFKSSKKVGEYLLPNGLLAEHYDVDGDGKKDVVALSSVTGSAPAGSGDVPHQMFPTFYIIDVDHDGSPDLVYVDVNGDGKCASVQLYEDLNAGPSRIKPGQVGGVL